MKKLKKIKLGQIVKVPYYQFAPMRSGWNGWLFTIGEVTAFGKNKAGEQLVKVNFINEQLKVKDGKCSMNERWFFVTRVFDASDELDWSQKYYDEANGDFDKRPLHAKIAFCLERNLIKLKEGA